MNKNIVPVLLGADLNCYSVARAFHEEFGVRSHAFGKRVLGESAHSRIIKFKKAENLAAPSELTKILLNFAKENEQAELYLVPCTDEYALAVSESGECLKEHYFFACPKRELAETLSCKENFYRMCLEHGIAFPKTEIFTKSSSFDMLENLPFPYPIIVKPSSSIEYWRSPFEGMKKVYTAPNREFAEKIISQIFASGYQNSIILQELIPAKEHDAFVLTVYSGKNNRVHAACMGRVLLGEHTPKGLGNHVAIVTEHHAEITEKLCYFLENIGYSGFANFDILFDRRDGAFKVLELNTRQGRSNYYMTAAGMNIAKLMVSDRNGEYASEKDICRESFFWHTVPKSIIYSYITEKTLEEKVRSLVKEGKESTTLFYPRELWQNPLRSAYVLIHNMRYFGKYNKYR